MERRLNEFNALDRLEELVHVDRFRRLFVLDRINRVFWERVLDRFLRERAEHHVSGFRRFGDVVACVPKGLRLVLIKEVRSSLQVIHLREVIGLERCGAWRMKFQYDID